MKKGGTESSSVPPFSFLHPSPVRIASPRRRRIDSAPSIRGDAATQDERVVERAANSHQTVIQQA